MPVSEDDFPSCSLGGTSHTWCGREEDGLPVSPKGTMILYVTMLPLCYCITYRFILVPNGKLRLAPLRETQGHESHDMSHGTLRGEADGICQNFQRCSNAHAHAYH